MKKKQLVCCYIVDLIKHVRLVFGVFTGEWSVCNYSLQLYLPGQGSVLRNHQGMEAVRLGIGNYTSASLATKWA